MSESEFLELLAPLEPYLKRMALAITGNEEDAYDALQEGLLAAFVARDQLRDAGAFKPWLKKIVAHQCGKQLHRRGRLIPMGRGAERIFEKKDYQNIAETDLIWDVVRQLPQPLTEVITLRYLADLPQKEIARALGIPEGTVKSRLHRALAALREILNMQKGGQANEV